MVPRLSSLEKKNLLGNVEVKNFIWKKQHDKTTKQGNIAGSQLIPFNI